MSTDQYPEPVYPLYIFERPDTSAEQLLSIARMRLRKEYAYPGLGPVHDGDELLIVTWPMQHEGVLEAIKQAMREAGAARVDHVFFTDFGIPDRRYSAADGWREIPDRLDAMTELGAEFSAEAHALKQFLDDRPGGSDTNYYAGEAAPGHWRRKAGGNVRGSWLYTTYESFISRANSFRDELWKLIDDKVCERFAHARAVRITDPQGTDIGWDVTEQQARLWPRGANLPGHILGSTIQAIRFANPVDTFLDEATTLLPTLNGVIAGTGNHTGFYPHIEVEVAGGMIREIRGGGKYGDLWREVVERFSHVEYPGFPYKGWAYFNDASIGTNPKAFRNSEGLWDYNDTWTNLPERLRAGVVHFGFGAEHWDERFVGYAKEHRLPIMHFPHVHVYFPTWEILEAGTGEWRTLIDKGWLTVLDDPDVRLLASTLGDPDQVLAYDWVPYVPGVNAPGDYERDYAPDPVAVIEREVQGEYERIR